MWCPLDALAEERCGVVGIATSLWTILYNITVLLCSLLYWREFIFRSASIDGSIIVSFHKSRCPSLDLLKFVDVCRSQTQDEYYWSHQ